MNASETIISSPVIVLVGPTAIGKTSLSIEIAHLFNCEVISMDSMQVYRYMDIGTAKVTAEEQDGIAHHLIDIRDPDQQYDAAMFVSDTLEAIGQITQKGKVPLITGGTGLYLSGLVNGLFEEVKVDQDARQKARAMLEEQGRALCYEKLKRIDPKTADRIHVNDTQRLLRGLEIYYSTGVPWSEHLQRQLDRPKSVIFSNLLVLGLQCSRDRLYQRIAKRADIMIASGFIDEVSQLLQMGYGKGLPSMQSIGYRQIVNMLDGKYDQDRAVEEITRDTRRYAKRQFTWFNKVDTLEWYDHAAHSSIIERIDRLMLESKES